MFLSQVSVIFSVFKINRADSKVFLLLFRNLHILCSFFYKNTSLLTQFGRFKFWLILSRLNENVFEQADIIFSTVLKI